MTRDDIREIVARELYVQDHAAKPSAMWSRSERTLHARREWYTGVSEKTRNRWRTAADSLIKSLGKSEIELRPSAQRSAVGAHMVDTAWRYGQQWTGPELEMLGRTDLSDMQLAVMLGRTHYAVRAQRRELRRGDPMKTLIAGISLERS